MSSFAKELAALMEARKWSLQDVMCATGRTKATVSAWLEGRWKPRQDALNALGMGKGTRYYVIYNDEWVEFVGTIEDCERAGYDRGSIIRRAAAYSRAVKIGQEVYGCCVVAVDIEEG